MESFSDPKIAKHATFVTPDGFVKGGQQLEPLRRALVDNGHLSRVTFHRDKVFKQSVNASITTFDNTAEHDSIDKTIVHADGTEEKGTLDWKYRDVVINEDKELIKRIFEEKVKASENNMSKLVTGWSPFGLTSACFRAYEDKFMEQPDKTHYIKMLFNIAKTGYTEKHEFYWVNPNDNFIRNGNRKEESITLVNSELYKMTFPRTAVQLADKAIAVWELGPGVIHPDKYLSIYSGTAIEINNIKKYFWSNFYRAGLASNMALDNRKVSARWHSLVPVQDFSNDSDIDWSGSLKSIDEQLYRKYGFTDEDIAIIDRFVTPAPCYSDTFAYADPRIERNDFASPSLYTVSDTLDDTADGGSVVGAGDAGSADDACCAGGSLVGEAGGASGGDSDEDVSVDGDADTADGGERVE